MCVMSLVMANQCPSFGAGKTRRYAGTDEWWPLNSDRRDLQVTAMLVEPQCSRKAIDSRPRGRSVVRISRHIKDAEITAD